LEKLYHEVSNFKLISLEKIINLFKENFDKKIKTANFSAEDIDNFKIRGLNYISNYYNKSKPFSQTKVLAIEENLNFKLPN